MVIKTSGYTNKTAERYLMDAGAVYKNLTFDEATGEASGELLGATNGGNEFALEQETREVEVDGVKGRTKGNTILVRENANLTVNLKELTADNVALAIAGSVNKLSNIEGYREITGKGFINLEDYTDSIALVARLTGSNKPVIIVLHNVLSMEGFTLPTEDEGEATIALNLGAHYDADAEGNVNSPYTIYWPLEA
ncbi:hypothetical protein B0H99_101374 [Planomicrobium soli]|uniref:Tail tube protein n=1 Tax=Planomicrobium soli TaxID=1176648 RepID=A0A2P8H7C6_9BACL|nr:hypothetical protein [Planomicrobium soli]PSL42126.1 hypothetical protein B0H99_101374 [Planomicrobium soli]